MIGSVGDLGHVVGIRAPDRRFEEQSAELIAFKAEHVDVVVETGELSDLERQEAPVPGGLLVGAVVGDAVGACLGGREVASHVNGDRLPAQALGGQQTGVTDDDDALTIDHDRLAKAELLERARDLGDRAFGTEARVARVGDDALDRPDVDGKIARPCCVARVSLCTVAHVPSSFVRVV